MEQNDYKDSKIAGTDQPALETSVASEANSPQPVDSGAPDIRALNERIGKAVSSSISCAWR